METFTEIRELVENPLFPEQKQQAQRELAVVPIDQPIVGLIDDINKLSYCFTLQCCHGHFVYPGQDNPHKIAPLPRDAEITEVEYRIAYIAFCLDNCDRGRRFFDDLHEIVAIDPANIQLGSPTWFWNRQINSYALQVEPDRFKYRDTANIGYQEALKVESVRDEFYSKLSILIKKLLAET
jgi:hypothetical protein